MAKFCLNLPPIQINVIFLAILFFNLSYASDRLKREDVANFRPSAGNEVEGHRFNIHHDRIFGDVVGPPNTPTAVHPYNAPQGGEDSMPMYPGEVHQGYERSRKGTVMDARKNLVFKHFARPFSGSYPGSFSSNSGQSARVRSTTDDVSKWNEEDTDGIWALRQGPHKKKQPIEPITLKWAFKLPTLTKHVWKNSDFRTANPIFSDNWPSHVWKPPTQYYTTEYTMTQSWTNDWTRTSDASHSSAEHSRPHKWTLRKGFGNSTIKLKKSSSKITSSQSKLSKKISRINSSKSNPWKKNSKRTSSQSTPLKKFSRRTSSQSSLSEKASKRWPPSKKFPRRTSSQSPPSKKTAYTWPVTTAEYTVHPPGYLANLSKQTIMPILKRPGFVAKRNRCSNYLREPGLLVLGTWAKSAKIRSSEISSNPKSYYMYSARRDDIAPNIRPHKSSVVFSAKHPDKVGAKFNFLPSTAQNPAALMELADQRISSPDPFLTRKESHQTKKSLGSKPWRHVKGPLKTSPSETVKVDWTSTTWGYSNSPETRAERLTDSWHEFTSPRPEPTTSRWTPVSAERHSLDQIILIHPESETTWSPQHESTTQGTTKHKSWHLLAPPIKIKGTKLSDQQFPGQQSPFQQFPSQQSPDQQLSGQPSLDQRLPGQQSPFQHFPSQQSSDQQLPGQQLSGQGSPDQQLPGQQPPYQQFSGQQPSDQQLPGQQLSGQGLPDQQLPGQQPPYQQFSSQHPSDQQLPGQQLFGQGSPDQQLPGQQSPFQQFSSQQPSDQQLPGQQLSGQGLPDQQLPGQQPPYQQFSSQQPSDQQLPGQQLSGQGLPDQQLPGQQPPYQLFSNQHFPDQRLSGPQSADQHLSAHQLSDKWSPGKPSPDQSGPMMSQDWRNPMIPPESPVPAQREEKRETLSAHELNNEHTTKIHKFTSADDRTESTESNLKDIVVLNADGILETLHGKIVAFSNSPQTNNANADLITQQTSTKKFETINFKEKKMKPSINLDAATKSSTNKITVIIMHTPLKPLSSYNVTDLPGRPPGVRIPKESDYFEVIELASADVSARNQSSSTSSNRPPTEKQRSSEDKPMSKEQMLEASSALLMDFETTTTTYSEFSETLKNSSTKSDAERLSSMIQGVAGQEHLANKHEDLRRHMHRLDPMNHVSHEENMAKDRSLGHPEKSKVPYLDSHIPSDAPECSTVVKSLLQCLSRKKDTSWQQDDESDPLIGFFVNMANTVKRFSIDDQVKIKEALFKTVSALELQHKRHVPLTPGRIPIVPDFFLKKHRSAIKQPLAILKPDKGKLRLKKKQLKSAIKKKSYDQLVKSVEEDIKELVKDLHKNIEWKTVASLRRNKNESVIKEEVSKPLQNHSSLSSDFKSEQYENNLITNNEVEWTSKDELNPSNAIPEPDLLVLNETFPTLTNQTSKNSENLELRNNEIVNSISGNNDLELAVKEDHVLVKLTSNSEQQVLNMSFPTTKNQSSNIQQNLPLFENITNNVTMSYEQRLTSIGENNSTNKIPAIGKLDSNISSLSVESRASESQGYVPVYQQNDEKANKSLYDKLNLTKKEDKSYSNITAELDELTSAFNQDLTQTNNGSESKNVVLDHENSKIVAEFPGQNRTEDWFLLMMNATTDGKLEKKLALELQHLLKNVSLEQLDLASDPHNRHLLKSLYLEPQATLDIKLKNMTKNINNSVTPPLMSSTVNPIENETAKDTSETMNQPTTTTDATLIKISRNMPPSNGTLKTFVIKVKMSPEDSKIVDENVKLEVQKLKQLKEELGQVEKFTTSKHHTPDDNRPNQQHHRQLYEFGPESSRIDQGNPFLKYMRDKKLGNFTGFAACVMDILSKKSEGDIFNLALGFKKAFYSWQTTASLNYFGQPFLNHVESYVSEMDKLTPLEMNHHAVMIYHLIEMKETALDPTLRAILNYTDSLYTIYDMGKMLALLEKLVHYPSMEQDSQKLADDLIRIVFINPSQRMGYGENRTILVEALNYWMSEKFGGKVRFPEIPDEQEKVSRRDFRTAAKPTPIQKNTNPDKFSVPVAVPVPRKIMRKMSSDTRTRFKLTTRNFYEDVKANHDNLRLKYNEDEDDMKYYISKSSKSNIASNTRKQPPNKVTTRILKGYNNDGQRNKNTSYSKKMLLTTEDTKLNPRRRQDSKYLIRSTINHNIDSMTKSTIRSRQYSTIKTKKINNIYTNRQTQNGRPASDKATSNNYRRNYNSQQKFDTYSMKSSTETDQFGRSDGNRRRYNSHQSKDYTIEKDNDNFGAGIGGLTDLEQDDFSYGNLSSEIEFLNKTRRDLDSSLSAEKLVGSAAAAFPLRHANEKRLTRKILEYDTKKHATDYEENLSDGRRRHHHRHHRSHHPHHSHHKHRKKVSQRARDRKRHQKRHKSVHNVVRDKLRQSQKMMGHLDHSFKKEKASHENKRHKRRGHKRKRHHRHKRRGRKRHKRRSEERSYGADRPNNKHRVDKKRFDVVKFTPQQFTFESPAGRSRFTTMPEMIITTPPLMETGIWTPPSSMITPFNIFNSNPYPIIPLNKSGMVRSYPMSSPVPKKMNWVERNKKETRQKILRRLISKRMEAKRAAEKKKQDQMKIEEEKNKQELLMKGFKGADKWKMSLTQLTTNNPSKVSIPFHPQNKQRQEPVSTESKDSGSTYKGNRRRLRYDDHQTKNNETELDGDLSVENNNPTEVSGQRGIEEISSKELNARSTEDWKYSHRHHNSKKKLKHLSLKQRQLRNSPILSEENKPNDKESEILNKTNRILNSNVYQELKETFEGRIGEISKNEKVRKFLGQPAPAPSSKSDEEDVLRSNLYKALDNSKKQGDSPEMQDNKYVDKNDGPYGRLTK